MHAHCIHLRLLHRTLQGHSLALIALDRLAMDENPHHLLQLLLATRLVPRGPTQDAARRGALHAIGFGFGLVGRRGGVTIMGGSERTLTEWLLVPSSAT